MDTEQTNESDPSEAMIQSKLECIFGKGHVTGKTGIPDIATDRVLIEIKHVRHWSDGLGQLLRYAQEFHAERTILYLFGTAHMMDTWNLAKDTCTAAKVEVLRDDVDYESFRQEYEAETPAKALIEGAPIHILEGNECNTITDNEYKVMQAELEQATRCAVKAVRDYRHFDKTYGSTECVRLYNRCKESLHDLQEFIYVINDDKAIAAAFIREVVVFQPGEVIPTRTLHSALKEWLALHKVTKFAKYGDRVKILLELGGAVYNRSKMGRQWIGIKLKSVKPTLTSS